MHLEIVKALQIFNSERGFRMWRWISETEVHVSLGWRWIRTVKLQLKVTLWAEIHIWVKIICSSDNAFRSWQLPNTCYPGGFPGVSAHNVLLVFTEPKIPAALLTTLFRPPRSCGRAGRSLLSMKRRKRGVLISSYSVYWADSTAQWRLAGNKSVTLATEQQIQLFLSRSTKLWAIPRCFSLQACRQRAFTQKN